MSNGFDLYGLIKSYATNNRVNIILYSNFLQAVQRKAKSYDQSNPFYRDLAIHPESIINPKLFQLAKEKKLSLQLAGKQIHQICLPEEYIGKIRQQYLNMASNADIPFPDEASLGISIPQEWVLPVSVDVDLPAYLDQGREPTVPIFRLSYPSTEKYSVILSGDVDGKLLEYAILKFRFYLTKGSNRDFIQQRLSSSFMGKELMVKENITNIMMKPFDSIEAMKKGKSSFTYPFWAYLSSAIKKDLAGKGEPTSEDISVLQAAHLVDVYNNHYKARAQREQDREAAFKTLENLLAKSPFLYSMHDILDFRDNQGRPLLGKYSREELEQWLQTETRENEARALPKLLIVVLTAGRSLFILKDKLLPYLVRAIAEARTAIRTLIVKDWQAAMSNYRSMDAMEMDSSFRDDLKARLIEQSLVLNAVLDSQLAPLVFAETSSKSDNNIFEQWFDNNRTASLDILLDLNRKRLLSEVKMMLPIWYSFPVFAFFAKWFKTRAKNKAEKKAAIAKVVKKDSQPGTQKTGTETSRAVDFALAARNAEKAMLPQGYTLDEYLLTLIEKWNRILEPVAKANLTEDINNLVRDYLRRILRTMKPSSLTPERLNTMASNLAGTSNLQRIRNIAALTEYIKLYMIRVLKN